MSDQPPVVRLLRDVVGLGKLEVIDRLMSPDAIDHGPSLIGAGPPGRTRESVMALREAMPDLTVDIERLLTCEEATVVRWALHGRLVSPLFGLSANGQNVGTSATTIYRVEDGLIIESWGNWDALGLQHQAGS